MKLNKKALVIILMLFCSLAVFSETFVLNKVEMKYNYYNAPYYFKFGYLFQKNSFAVFPNIGLSFSYDSGARLKSLAGVNLSTPYVKWGVLFDYDVINSSEKLFFNNTKIYSFQNDFSIPFTYGIFSFLSTFGNDGFYISEKTKNIEKFFKQTMLINALLYENGFMKNTITAKMNYYNIYENDFAFCDADFSILNTLYLNYFDIAIAGNFFTSFKTDETKNDYLIGKKYSYLTKRMTKEEDNFYNTMMNVETEVRYYFLRHIDVFSNFFLSAFGNIGSCFETDDVRLKYQYGIGVGYSLFDTVPFTFQIGLNEDNKLCMYVSVVSALSHMP